MNVKQLLDKEGTHTEVCVLRSLGPEIQGAHQGRRPFSKAITDAMGKAVIGQSPGDAVCPPPRRKVRLHLAKTIAVESADTPASSPSRFAKTESAQRLMYDKRIRRSWCYLDP